jgi:hypothetical protein
MIDILLRKSLWSAKSQYETLNLCGLQSANMKLCGLQSASVSVTVCHSESPKNILKTKTSTIYMSCYKDAVLFKQTDFDSI